MAKKPPKKKAAAKKPAAPKKKAVKKVKKAVSEKKTPKEKQTCEFAIIPAPLSKDRHDFELFKDADGFGWRVNAGNGETIARASQQYKSRDSAAGNAGLVLCGWLTTYGITVIRRLQL